MNNIKIYLHKISPKQINVEKMHKQFQCKNIISNLEIHSLDFGFHISENDEIYRIEPSFKEHYKLIKDYNGFDLIIDENTYTKIPLLSQLPHECIVTHKFVLEFKQGTKSKISCKVECIQEKCKETLNEKMIPIDFYFACKKDDFDIQNSFFQNELNVFLSELN